jgi:hypothetical protein
MTLGSRLARPREVRSPEKEVLEWWLPVRVRERESKEEDNGWGFKYPQTHAQEEDNDPLFRACEDFSYQHGLAYGATTNSCLSL